jgi:hypothetical protein
MIRIIIIALLITSPAFAQDLRPRPRPVAPCLDAVAKYGDALELLERERNGATGWAVTIPAFGGFCTIAFRAKPTTNRAERN